MDFHIYGVPEKPTLLLLPGLGVSHEIFLPLMELLKEDFRIVTSDIDGFLLGKPSRFTSVDDQAAQAIRYVQENLDGRLDIAYGLSLGGKILSRMLERNEIVIDHAIMDAAPLLPLPRWTVGPLRHYQALNVWTCYHWTGFWRWVFHSHYFDVLLKMLHPFMPFITEELWQALYERQQGDSIMRESLKLDAPTDAETKLISDFEQVKQIVSGVRMVRSQKNIAPKETLELQAVNANNYTSFTSAIQKMANVSTINVVNEKDATASAFMVGTDEFAVPLGNMIDIDAEIEKQETQLKHLEGFLAGVMKKLSNERFVQNAPEQVVALERKKQSDSEEKIAALKESIAALKAQQK
jgi:pimeloyl-ACP methyl ester carboxylesterase